MLDKLTIQSNAKGYAAPMPSKKINLSVLYNIDESRLQIETEIVFEFRIITELFRLKL